jgi:hypothetical protein
VSCHENQLPKFLTTDSIWISTQRVSLMIKYTKVNTFNATFCRSLSVMTHTELNTRLLTVLPLQHC